MSIKKSGAFDWLVESSEFVRFLGPKFTGVICPKRCLVIGSGTSKLSEDLHNLEFGEIVSIDNDKDCIKHMKAQHNNKPDMKWIVADLITGSGLSNLNKDLHDESFDLIIDKGTFDAILVEGTVSPMLAHIYRMLKPEGAYVICSFNTEDLLQQLLFPQLIGWKISFFCADRTRIAVCNKTSSIKVDWSRITDEETNVLDVHFKSEKPLLTPEIETKIRNKFLASPSLSFGDAHAAIFDSLLPSLGYDFTLFKEDLKEFPVARSGSLTADEMIAFLKAKQ